MDLYGDIKRGEKGVWVSIAVYIGLAAVKLAVGLMAASEALAADGLNNTTDIAATLAILIGLKISRKPPDADHPYGHLRAETVASLVVSFIMMAVGLEVLYKAARTFLAGAPSAPGLISAWIALACAAVMFAVHRYNLRLAAKVGSQAVKAAAKDNLSDALVSIGAFAGIAGARVGLPWLDPVAAFAVGVVICKTAWDIFRDASHSLTDGFDEKRLHRLKQAISAVHGVERIHDIRARIYGNSVRLDVTIGVDPGLNVVESHAITERIEKVMYSEHRISEVLVHIEPVQGEKQSNS